MSRGDTSHRSADAQHEPGQQDESRTGRLPASNLSNAVRSGTKSGTLAGASGGVLALRGLRRFRRGARVRGLAQALVGGVLLAVAVVQRRSGRRGPWETGSDRQGIDQTDVVDTAPDLEGVESRSDSGPTDHASGDEATDVVDTAPDIDDAATAPEDREQDHATGDEAADVVDTGPDIESTASETASTREDEQAADADADQWTEPGTESGEDVAEWNDGANEESAANADESREWHEPDTVTFEGGNETDETGTAEGVTDETGTAEGKTDGGDTAEDYDRLGAAAFDEETNSLPAPQRAFNQEYLALEVEAVWGIRESDDAVVVSEFYDPIEAREDMRYVASSEVDEDRMLLVPDEILDHWDSLLDGGTAVESGDDLVFATSDDLTEENLLVVVPAEWDEDVPGSEE